MIEPVIMDFTSWRVVIGIIQVIIQVFRLQQANPNFVYVENRPLLLNDITFIGIIVRLFLLLFPVGEHPLQTVISEGCLSGLGVAETF